jgi:hypothetical protein
VQYALDGSGLVFPAHCLCAGGYNSVADLFYHFSTRTNYISRLQKRCAMGSNPQKCQIDSNQFSTQNTHWTITKPSAYTTVSARSSSRETDPEWRVGGCTEAYGQHFCCGPILPFFHTDKLSAATNSNNGACFASCAAAPPAIYHLCDVFYDFGLSLEELLRKVTNGEWYFWRRLRSQYLQQESYHAAMSRVRPVIPALLQLSCQNIKEFYSGVFAGMTSLMFL